MEEYKKEKIIIEKKPNIQKEYKLVNTGKAID